MNGKTLIPDEYLQTCNDLDSREDFAQLAARLRTLCVALEAAEVLKQARSLDPRRQAKAFLTLAGLGATPEQDTLLLALEADDETLAKACIFYVASCRADDEAILRTLLFGATPWEPSTISANNRYWLIQYLGFSGNASSIPVLLEAITKHPHFCPTGTIADALESLGYDLTQLGDAYRTSISVDIGTDELHISVDKKFTGSSNCPHCQYFPCRINRYYPGAIEDCSLWNRRDPATFGGLRDRRGDDPAN